ncbi:UDP-N-acetylmuramoyl-tripeptide--D-alanyl-D-alanine ligase [Glaciimonas sp. CA11.2]|uniref:UDP-N-acetylmuramoyl-tripeptide--D-alanyl-D- alanine ligase n=1 Tax=Glaciimonas sp. CA11.2 TaxID=3048601 RepID=UPI002AB561D5|nr:UDP-N-acetylmuramoyl-tripeptide--D-alanyl-D-alanine ligase [Glaciimonas sp. CA11.2]MDY7546491.1 UDP-N-acetylmuramoyl-tripeptide--D-alanyl-D-alanine ligase [Glaciimonas sp. CA11.2]MEB0161755.1 UDP-N-acetylmuramoyl-tripeptide--D-alanyl-D-alanine ligase [Glaciimonas sp. CA11.2]
MIKIPFTASVDDLQSWLQSWQQTVSLASINGSGSVAAGDIAITGLTTDSRAVVPGNLFVALRGERFDAHDFLDQVIAQGAAALIVERAPTNLSVPALIVADTRNALGAIANGWRRQFSLPLIAVTGSNGKTTVKEMIAAILAAAFGVDGYLSTRGNFNNEIGVPLTLQRLDASHRAAVIELGMNHPGEIAVLAAIAAPTVGLVNNAQREHQEFMASVEAVALENGAVMSALSDGGIAVFPADDPFTPLWRGLTADKGGGVRSLTFGFSADADVHCTYQPTAFGSILHVTTPKQTFAVRLDAAGEHNVRNALAAIACTLAIGIEISAIQQGLESFVPVSGRLQRKQAQHAGYAGALVIDDTYNANPDSVRAAIDVLAQSAPPRLLILGDMGEVGNDGPAFHQEIGEYAQQRGITHLLTLGALAIDATKAFGVSAQHFEDIAALIATADSLMTPATTVLVKGSRFMKMERVVAHLVSAPGVRDLSTPSSSSSPQETH